jgi:hypothetical protein
MKGILYAFNIFKSSWLTSIFCWQNTISILKLLIPLPDDSVCKHIFVLCSSKCPLHKNNRLQFNKTEHAQFFYLWSVHRTQTQNANHITDTGIVRHNQAYRKAWYQLAKKKWDKLHFCVKYYVSLLLNKIQSLKSLLCYVPLWINKKQPLKTMWSATGHLYYKVPQYYTINMKSRYATRHSSLKIHIALSMKC